MKCPTCATEYDDSGTRIAEFSPACPLCFAREEVQRKEATAARYDEWLQAERAAHAETRALLLAEQAGAAALRGALDGILNGESDDRHRPGCEWVTDAGTCTCDRKETIEASANAALSTDAGAPLLALLDALEALVGATDPDDYDGGFSKGAQVRYAAALAAVEAARKAAGRNA